MLQLALDIGVGIAGILVILSVYHDIHNQEKARNSDFFRTPSEIRDKVYLEASRKQADRDYQHQRNESLRRMGAGKCKTKKYYKK